MEEDLGGVYHPYWLEGQCGSHSYGDLNFRWGRGRKLEYGDHLLLPWSSQNWGLWCTLCCTSTQLTGAKCGSSERIHQHPLYPLRDFPSPLSRHEHSSWGCFLHPIPTGLASSTKATPFLWGQGDLASWRGEVELKVYSHSQEVLWESSEEEHCLSDPVLLLIPSSALHQCLEEGIQMEGGFTQASSFYKMPIKPELSWNVSWSRRHRSWHKDMTISRSNRQGGTKGGGHRWLSRQMPPYKRYFPRWVWQIPSRYCLGAFPQ